jgi:hypothetical protein
MTNQEAYDKMMKHLRSLKERSMEPGGRCVYNGTMCAIGSLMTDEEQEKFGDLAVGVSDLLSEMLDAGHTSKLHRLDDCLLDDMQVLHDDFNNWGPEGFTAEEHAKRIANSYGLNYS